MGESKNHNMAYRRIIIIDKKKCALIVDTTEIGPIREENHLREFFANYAKLKGVKGANIEVKTAVLATFYSSKCDEEEDDDE